MRPEDYRWPDAGRFERGWAKIMNGAFAVIIFLTRAKVN